MINDRLDEIYSLPVKDTEKLWRFIEVAKYEVPKWQKSEFQNYMEYFMNYMANGKELYRKTARLFLEKAAELRTADFFEYFDETRLRESEQHFYSDTYTPSLGWMASRVVFIVKLKKRYGQIPAQLQAVENNSLFLQNLSITYLPRLRHITEWLLIFQQMWKDVPRSRPHKWMLDIMNGIYELSEPDTPSSTSTANFKQPLDAVTLYLEERAPEETIPFTLSIIFTTLSIPRNLKPSLAALLVKIPLTYSSKLYLYMSTISKKNSNDLVRAFERLIEWLNYDIALGIGPWIVEYMEALRRCGFVDILVDVTIRTIRFEVFDRLRNMHHCEDGFLVLQAMLIGYQHSPDAFHLIIEGVPDLLELFVKENQLEILRKFSLIIQCLMYKFGGYPALYLPVSQKISFLNQHIFSSQEMSTFVKLAQDSRWIAVTSINDRVNIEIDEHSLLHSKTRTGKIGLRNLGNTCYANSSLQALFANAKLRKEVLLSTNSKDAVSYLRDTFAFLALSKRPSTVPGSRLHKLFSEFVEGRQEDASEFMKLLFNRIEQEEKDFWKLIKEMPDDSQWDVNSILNSIQGTLNNITQCNYCEAISIRKESFMDLRLCFDDTTEISKQTLDIITMLNQTLALEKLEGSNKYFCENCNELRDASRTMIITDPPPETLILSINRFKVEKSSSGSYHRIKISTPVNIPQEISLPVHTPDTKTAISTVTVLYELFAIIVHSGVSMDYGHYYTYAKNEDEDGKWYQFNDSTVTPSSYEMMSCDVQRFKNDTPYIIFYRLKGCEKIAEYEISASLVNMVAQADAQAIAMTSLYKLNEYTKKKRRDSDGDEADQNDQLYGRYVV